MREETEPGILPYSYHKLSQDRVMIVHPAGAKLTKRRSDIERSLDGGEIVLRPLSKHERLMLKEALKVFENGE